MPLQAGKSKRTFVQNIKELMAAYHRKGHIGSSPDESKAKANKRAVAIAYAKQRGSK
jgi:hypothetical protein